MKYLLLLLLTISSQADMLSVVEAKYSLPRGVLRAIATVESGGNPKAFVKYDGCSKHASHGLMQIQMAAARQMGFKGSSKELMLVENNVEYAGKYFNWLLKRAHGDVTKALLWYNSGPNAKNVNMKYVGKVLNAFIRN